MVYCRKSVTLFIDSNKIKGYKLKTYHYPDFSQRYKMKRKFLKSENVKKKNSEFCTVTQKYHKPFRNVISKTNSRTNLSIIPFILDLQ